MSVGVAGMIKGSSGPILGAAGGMADYGTEGAPAVGGQRRPHTAHGGRAGFPSSSQPIAGGTGQPMYDGEEVRVSPNPPPLPLVYI